MIVVKITHTIVIVMLNAQVRWSKISFILFIDGITLFQSKLFRLCFVSLGSILLGTFCTDLYCFTASYSSSGTRKTYITLPICWLRNANARSVIRSETIVSMCF